MRPNNQPSQPPPDPAPKEELSHEEWRKSLTAEQKLLWIFFLLKHLLEEEDGCEKTKDVLNRIHGENID